VSDIRRLLLFLVAGGINTLFGYAAFALLLHLGFPTWAAVLLGTIAGILFNFGSIGTVFKSHDSRRLPRFLLVYTMTFIANLMLLRLLSAAGIPVLAGQAMVTLLLAPCSFLAMRHLVFTPFSSLEPRA
jgi:putative flippase GtrA